MSPKAAPAGSDHLEYGRSFLRQIGWMRHPGVILAAVALSGLSLALTIDLPPRPSAILLFAVVLIAGASFGSAALVFRRHAVTHCPYLELNIAATSPAGHHESAVPDSDAMLRCAARHIQRVLRARTVAIFSRSPGSYVYRLSGQAGLDDAAEISFERDSVLVSELHGSSGPRLQRLPPCERAKVRATGGALLVPLRLRDDLIGFINLGSKVPRAGFTSREEALLTTMAGQLALALDHVRLCSQERENACARDIQEGLLPREIPQLPGYEIATAWQPARVLSGDYFDVLRLDAKSLALCIADVAGKGVPAALLMASMQASVKAFAGADVAPADLCSRVNRVVAGNIAAGRFISFFYGVLDAARHAFAYTNAGHNPPLLLRCNGSVNRLETGGPVLGLIPEARYEQGVVELHCGERLLMFTDGLTEAGISLGEEFGEDRLIRTAFENPRAGARILRSAVMDALQSFAPGTPEDDVTLVVVTARGRDGCAGCPQAVH